jgi:hypothetical protein
MKLLTFDQMDDDKLEEIVAFVRMIAGFPNFEDIQRDIFEHMTQDGETIAAYENLSFEEHLNSEQKDLDYLESSDEQFENFIADARRILQIPE